MGAGDSSYWSRFFSTWNPRLPSMESLLKPESLLRCELRSEYLLLVDGGIIRHRIMMLQNHRPRLPITLCNALTDARLAIKIKLRWRHSAHAQRIVLIALLVAFICVWVLLRLKCHALLSAYKLIPDIFGSKSDCIWSIFCQYKCLVVFHAVAHAQLRYVTRTNGTIWLSHYNVSGYPIHFGVYAFYINIFVGSGVLELWLAFFANFLLLRWT